MILSEIGELIGQTFRKLLLTSPTIGATGIARPKSVRKKKAMRKPKGLFEFDEYHKRRRRGVR